MDNFDQPDDIGMAAAKDDGLLITEEVRHYWKQIATWAMFFAVLLLIMFGLVSLVLLFTAFKGGAMGLIIGLFGIGLYGVFLFFPGLYYYRFSSQMKAALATDDNGLLEQSFVNLKSFYRYVGIMIIVFVSIMVLYLLVFGAALMNGRF